MWHAFVARFCVPLLLRARTHSIYKHCGRQVDLAMYNHLASTCFHRTIKTTAGSSLRFLTTLSEKSVSFQERVRKIGGAGCIKVSKSSAHVAHLTIDNPKARNALTGKMLAQLGDAVISLAKDKNLVMCTLSGNQGFFSSGADLQLVNELFELRRPFPLADESVTDRNYGGLLMCSYMQEVSMDEDMFVIHLGYIWWKRKEYF